MNRPLTATILVLSMLITLVMGYWLVKSKNDGIEMKLVASYCLAELFLYFANKLLALMSMN